MPSPRSPLVRSRRTEQGERRTPTLRARDFDAAEEAHNCRLTCDRYSTAVLQDFGLAGERRPYLEGTMSAPIYRKGLGLSAAVDRLLARDYHSALVDHIKASRYRYETGRLTVYLAREFGFCYGVDRAVDYAYQARQRFPGRPLWLTSEIIHNPHVNTKLRGAGVRFLTDPGARGSVGTGRCGHHPGLWRPGAGSRSVRATGMHGCRYHMWVGAQRLEERQTVCQERLHGGDSWQARPRGNPCHGIVDSGVPEWPISHRP